MLALFKLITCFMRKHVKICVPMACTCMVICLCSCVCVFLCCVCVFLCVSVSVGTCWQHQCVWESKDSLGCQSSPSTLFEAGSPVFTAEEARLDGLQAFGGSPVSCFPFLPRYAGTGEAYSYGWLYTISGNLDSHRHACIASAFSTPRPPKPE